MCGRLIQVERCLLYYRWPDGAAMENDTIAVHYDLQQS